MDRWSNEACMGYAILAAEEMGIGEDTTRELVELMEEAFDFYTIEEAEEHWKKSKY